MEVIHFYAYFLLPAIALILILIDAVPSVYRKTKSHLGK